MWTERRKKKNHLVPLQYLQVRQEQFALLVISSFFFLSREWWAQNRPFTDWNQISVMRPAAVNGSHAGGCQREGVCLSPPHVISARWPCPRRHQRVADVICSHSAVTWRNGNQWRWRLQQWQRQSEREGKLGCDRKRVSDLVGSCIYLPDTLTSCRTHGKTLPPSTTFRGIPNSSMGKVWRLRSL